MENLLQSITAEPTDISSGLLSFPVMFSQAFTTLFFPSLMFLWTALGTCEAGVQWILWVHMHKDVCLSLTRKHLRLRRREQYWLVLFCWSTHLLFSSIHLHFLISLSFCTCTIVSLRLILTGNLVWLITLALTSQLFRAWSNIKTTHSYSRNICTSGHNVFKVLYHPHSSVGAP